MSSTTKHHRITSFLFCFIVCFVAFFLLTSTIWLKKEFGEVTIEQILYHLQYGAEGLEGADKSIIEAFIRKCLLTPLLLSLLASLVIHDFRKNIMRIFWQLIGKITAFLKRFDLIQKILSMRPHFLLLSFSAIYALNQFSFFSYAWDAISPNGVDFYEQYYVSPSQVTITTDNPRNLLLIYVESLESTYADKNIFEENLLNSISPETLNGISFEKQRQIPGTGWTMAGIVATQCGVPLRPSFGGGWDRKNAATEITSLFLPGIQCLGDILKKQGYKNVFMGGASLGFAGKGNFLKTHGYDETYGRDEFNQTDLAKLAQNHWGIFDDVLLGEAKKKLDVLENGSQPYNLTLLTLDTHGPAGSFSKTCHDQGAIAFNDIIRCTSNMLAELVSYMDTKGYLENTTVVIMGDHLVMENTLSKKLKRAQQHYIFNTYLAKNFTLTKNRDEITHVDHLPTILDSMNLKVDGGKLGLGVSGFYNGSTLDYKERFKLLNQNATKKSKKYLSFWSNNKGDN